MYKSTRTDEDGTRDVVWDYQEKPDGIAVQCMMEVPEAEALVVSGSAILYDTVGEICATIAYKDKRRESFPAMEDQLDMQYHELETTGSLSISGSWFNTIKTVKDANPKP